MQAPLTLHSLGWRLHSFAMEPISTKGAQVEFTAVRDVAGVPHVTAPTWREALYALGYLHAVDRPTQMFFSRTVASGQAAERLSNKPELVETDIFFRRANLIRNLDLEVARLREETREQLQWYCDGLNDALQESGRTLPMLVTGFRPRPWRPESVLLIGNLLSFAGLAIGAQENERLLLDLVQTGVDPELLRELFSPNLDGVDLEPLLNIKMERRLSDDALEMLADLPRLAGSNAWAVSPRRSASGGALLAADPHLEVNRLPAIWYEVALSWGEGRYAMGATLPGCPLMAVGRTEKLAWGVTYMHADTSDFFIEDCRQSENGTWQYRRGESWHDLQVREEVISRKGASPYHLRVFENELATLARDLTDQEPGHYLSVKWIGSSEGAGESIRCWLDVIHAEDAQTAMGIVRDNPHPTLVWVFADKAGHIGRQVSGWLPRRSAGHVGVLPAPAWDEYYHWLGKQPVDVLPALYDPPEGYLASANEDLDRANETLISTHGLSDYRKRQIVARLHELHAATVEDMQQIQYDFFSRQASDLLKIFLPHVPPGDFKDALSEWDFCYDPESTSAVRFQHLYRHVLLETFGHEEGIGWRRMFYLCTRMGYSSMVLTAIDQLLQREESLWWRQRDKGAIIRQAAEQAAAEPVKKWGEVNSFHFTNRFFEAARVGRLLGFHTQQMAMPGCQASPFQGHLKQTATRESSFAPSYHFVTDLTDEHAWTNLPGGPAESRFSKWYRSDIAHWADGKYRRLAPALVEPAA